MSLSIPPSGSGSWARIEPTVPAQRPRALGENREADSQDTRERTSTAREEALRRRNHVREHPIQSNLVEATEESSGQGRSSENRDMTGRELLFWAILIVLAFVALFWR